MPRHNKILNENPVKCHRFSRNFKIHYLNLSQFVLATMPLESRALETLAHSSRIEIRPVRDSHRPQIKSGRPVFSCLLRSLRTVSRSKRSGFSVSCEPPQELGDTTTLMQNDAAKKLNAGRGHMSWQLNFIED
jgi:hypothetical protein